LREYLVPENLKTLLSWVNSKKSLVTRNLKTMATFRDWKSVRRLGSVKRSNTDKATVLVDPLSTNTKSLKIPFNGNVSERFYLAAD
jgi:hypothetical protein